MNQNPAATNQVAPRWSQPGYYEILFYKGV
jgi:hypothetical protein